MQLLRTICAFCCVLWLAACQCSHPPVAPKQKEKGEPCGTDTECVTGLCDKLPGETELKCLQKCTAGCAGNEICTALDVSRFGCVPERMGLCKPCTTNADCPYTADLCVTVAGSSFCGRDCSFDSTCPNGYHCEAGFDRQGNQVGVQCQPVSGTCACTPANVGQSVPCELTNSYGTCVGTQTCQAAGYTACSTHTPAYEVCNGVDDDCNGMTDENLGQKSCGVGECARTVDNCVAGAPNPCTPGDAGVETCNDKDDDCNGVVDDGFNKSTSLTDCGTCGNVCTVANGTPNCVAGNCGIAGCTAPYANCNNLVPDGCETNTDTSTAHCGGCNKPCAGINATGTCAGGICTIACLPGFVDLDGNPANGCEYACTVTSTTDFPDLGFVDANCDGIDGEVNNSIFVSAAGNDANPGTRALPKGTIQGGLNAAVAQNKRDVLISVGNYANQISMPSNLGAYGGYAPVTWTRATANIVNVNNVNTPLLISNVTNVTVQLMNFLGTSPAAGGATAYGAMILSSSGVTLEALQIRAGNGGLGTNGAAGTVGDSGSSGNLGQPGVENSGALLCDSNAQPQGGLGGTSTCGRTGGRGGNPGVSGNFGSAGGAGVGGTPGGSGVPNGWGNFAPGAPYIGGIGTDGSAGIDGVSALGFGTLNAAGYVAALATNGVAGSHGNGGGGGGGGGGGTTNCDSYGGAGAGGGAGGCGGGFGLRGLSGGASIAVYLYGSTVTAKAVSLTTGNGGLGGNGGAGALGGVGGAGAISSQGAGNEYGGSSEQDDGSNGGKGGKGGAGGVGGNGGAGGGGPVIGVARGGSSTWTADGASTISLGTPGSGGLSAAGNGADGLAQALY